MFNPNFRIVETDPDCLVAVYDGSIRCDLFESREEAAVWVDHMLRLRQVDNRFMEWVKQVTEDLELHDQLEVLMFLQVTVGNLVYSLSHPEERQG
ncbi:MAG TPA: hypothetical protein VFA32_18460 [Dehalococcoidia bacterium]|nr:hypothetical protein [Dehalococcoidia bacterium]